MTEICDYLGVCKALVYRTLKRSRAGEPLDQRNPSKRARIRGPQLQSIRRTTSTHYMDPACPRAPREGPVSTVQQLVRLVIVAVSVRAPPSGEWLSSSAGTLSLSEPSANVTRRWECRALWS